MLNHDLHISRNLGMVNPQRPVLTRDVGSIPNPASVRAGQSGMPRTSLAMWRTAWKDRLN